MSKQQLMTGNEAIARGVYEAGVRFAAAYPGTPSTEILENLTNYKEIDAQWSPNEKVALEVAYGASIAGARSFASMKHVGLNVAADPFFTIAYTGGNAGLVVLTADEPGQHSSQNEQDNRNYARHAKVPMLEPSDRKQEYGKICFRTQRKVRNSRSDPYDYPSLPLQEPCNIRRQSGKRSGSLRKRRKKIRMRTR